jgi:hypothetical protein
MDKKPTDRGVVDSIRALREKRYMTRGPGAKLKTPSDTAKRVAMLQQLVDAVPPTKSRCRRRTAR